MFDIKRKLPIRITIQIGDQPPEPPTRVAKPAKPKTDLQRLRAMGDTREMYQESIRLAEDRGYLMTVDTLMMNVPVTDAKPFAVGFYLWGTGKYNDEGYDVLGRGKTRAAAYMDALKKIYKWER